MSFHLPLHRYFAVFLNQAIRLGGTLDELIPSTDMLNLLMMHPLHTQVCNFLIFYFEKFIFKTFLYLTIVNLITFISYFVSNAKIKHDVYMIK